MRPHLRAELLPIVRQRKYPASSVHVSPPLACALQSSVWKHKADQDTTEPRLLALGPDSTTTTCTSTISSLEPKEVPATH